MYSSKISKTISKSNLSAAERAFRRAKTILKFKAARPKCHDKKGTVHCLLMLSLSKAAYDEMKKLCEAEGIAVVAEWCTNARDYYGFAVPVK